MKRSFKNIIIYLLLGTYIYLYVFYILSKFLKYSEPISAASMIIITFVAYLFYGYAKDKRTYAKKSFFQIILTQIVIFFLVTYGLGLIVGFLENSYSLKIFSIVDNVFAPFILIISMELLRYIFIVPNKNNKLGIAILTIMFIVVESLMSFKVFPLDEVGGIFRFITLIVLPVSIKHGMLSFVTYYVGYKPSILYRIIMDGYVYIVPISPDLGEYLSSIFGIGMPFLVYIYCSRFIHEYNEGVEREFISTTFKPFDFAVIIFFLLLVAMISGYFPVFMLGVGSASMAPNINVGDAVVGIKVKQKDLKKDDVIVYKGEKNYIIHRLISIEKKGNKYYYHTKGDNNNTEDGVDISYDSVKGKVIFRIPYIAYPSIYFKELLRGDD